VTAARAQEIRAGLGWLRAADPVLAQLIDERPDFDPDVWVRRLPAMGLFGALVFQIIGQQISVIAATAIFARLTGQFGGRVPGADELAALHPGTLRDLGLSWRKAATVLELARRFSDGRLSEAELGELPDQEVIRQLTQIKGIGAWTVQGALLIALQRPDVIRPDDLALRPRDPGPLRPRSPSGLRRGGGPRPALEAVPEPGLQPAAGRREIELIQRSGARRLAAAGRDRCHQQLVASGNGAITLYRRQ
jgi:DNA-3-methyladenine glycosylase II